jgi:hypothetical protein
MIEGAPMTTLHKRSANSAAATHNRNLARDERMYTAACEYEQTLSTAKLMELAATVMGSWRSMLVLRR